MLDGQGVRAAALSDIVKVDEVELLQWISLKQIGQALLGCIFLAVFISFWFITEVWAGKTG